MGSASSRPKYSFFCSSVPARISGMAPSELPATVVLMPTQP